MIDMTYTVKQLREELGKTQMQVAVKAEVSLNAVVNAENPKKRLHYSTLMAILKALNSFRQDAGQSDINPNEMEWNIR